MYDVGSRYQAANSEGIEVLMRAIVNCKVCELVIAVQFFVVTVCKCPINAVTIRNPVSSHLTRADMK
jgi:hypothetical protein